MNVTFRSRESCGGMVLFVAMVVLLMLSLLGMAMAHSAILENRMAAGTRSQQLATMAGNAALAEGRALVIDATANFGAAQVCSHVACTVRPTAAPDDPGEFMLTPAARAASISYRIDFTTLDGEDRAARLQANPAFVLEDLGESDAVKGQPRLRWFRVTAIGWGAAPGVSTAVENSFSVVEK